MQLDDFLVAIDGQVRCDAGQRLCLCCCAVCVGHRLCLCCCAVCAGRACCDVCRRFMSGHASRNGSCPDTRAC